MNFNELKKVAELAHYLDIDSRELAEKIGASDFEVENYRFIKETDAIDLLLEQYHGDPYLLGCFNDWFISDCCDIPLSVVSALQKNELFEELGLLMINSGIDELINEYISLDGYGHAFGSYDHSFYDVSIDGIDYIYFRHN